LESLKHRLDRHRYACLVISLGRCLRTRVECSLYATEGDGASYRSLDELGQGLALPEDGLEFGAQLGLDADLGNDGCLHAGSVLRVGYTYKDRLLW
jgi:hypothetical protein